MSTRVTLAKDAEQHLYRELADDSIHLEIHFWNKLTLNIPLSEKILQSECLAQDLTKENTALAAENAKLRRHVRGSEAGVGGDA